MTKERAYIGVLLSCELCDLVFLGCVVSLLVLESSCEQAYQPCQRDLRAVSPAARRKTPLEELNGGIAAAQGQQ